MTTVNIKHKEFNSSAEFRTFVDSLVSSDIITSVHKRLTRQYVNLPFAIRLRPYDRYNNRTLNIAEKDHFVTFYINEDVVLPGKIQDKIDSLEYTTDTIGNMPEFIYLGEILPMYHIHIGFFRMNHFYRKDDDYYQRHNDNSLIVMKLYDGLTAEEATKMINTKQDKYIKTGWYYGRIVREDSIEVKTFITQELEGTQQYYECLLERVQYYGETELLSQVVENFTDFAADRLTDLRDESLRQPTVAT